MCLFATYSENEHSLCGGRACLARDSSSKVGSLSTSHILLEVSLQPANSSSERIVDIVGEGLAWKRNEKKVKWIKWNGVRCTESVNFACRAPILIAYCWKATHHSDTINKVLHIMIFRTVVEASGLNWKAASDFQKKRTLRRKTVTALYVWWIFETSGIKRTSPFSEHTCTEFCHGRKTPNTDVRDIFLTNTFVSLYLQLRFQIELVPSPTGSVFWFALIGPMEIVWWDRPHRLQFNWKRSYVVHAVQCQN